VSWQTAWLTVRIDQNAGAVQFSGDHLSILQFEFGIGVKEVDGINYPLDLHNPLVDQNGIIIIHPVNHRGKRPVGHISRGGRAGRNQEKY
jgi:hypothetical protein